MSNRIVIEQQEIKIKHSSRIDKQISISDDYESGVIDLETNDVHSLFDDDLELLEFIVKTINEDGGIAFAQNILGSAKNGEKGMNIEGVWYDYKDIKHILEKVE